MRKIYAAPSFIKHKNAQEVYSRWLHRRAVAHVKRDSKRGNKTATVPTYKKAIHIAVLNSDGLDFYTGEKLKWSLLSKYDNAESKKHGRVYKRKFALLPSVDHVGNGKGAANFKICAWRTNDCKNDLTYTSLRRFCRLVLKHAGEIT